MARVGTLVWADATGGVLRRRDRLELLLLQAPPELARQGAELIRLARPIDLAVLQPIVKSLDDHIPTTAVARRAADLLERAADPWLVNHCYRVFAFGLLLGVGSGVDAETLFVMAMLHDLGLTDEYRRQPSEGLDAPCFAVRGARVAQGVASDEVAEGIALHLNLRVPRSRLAAHLLQAGTGLDVAGLRYRRLPAAAIEAVTARWRRGPIRREVWKALNDEAMLHQGCRGRFLERWGCLRRRVARAPFPD